MCDNDNKINYVILFNLFIMSLSLKFKVVVLVVTSNLILKLILINVRKNITLKPKLQILNLKPQS